MEAFLVFIAIVLLIVVLVQLSSLRNSLNDIKRKLNEGLVPIRKEEAVVVVDGRITFVGKIPDALRRAPPGARRMDLQGATVLPGLTDAHAHLGGIGERELTFT